MSAPEAPSLETLHALELLGELDLHFARSMLRLGGESDPRVALAAAIVSRQVQAGHVCLDLPRLCAHTLALESEALGDTPVWPALEGWLAALRASSLVGGSEAGTPLYLDQDGRLYLRRYYEYERALARDLLERAARTLSVERTTIERSFDRLFGAKKPKDNKERKPTPSAQLELFDKEHAERPLDLQRVAAERALERSLCVISGGPGTGKTSTVVKILAALCEDAANAGRTPPRTCLLAPTGKAAARLSEAIKRQKSELACAPATLAAIEEEASTIHRALLGLPGRGRRVLPADVVVVDEASMVDLALMARLLGAVPAEARLILLGDKDQLASVEAGAVLGDICGAGLSEPKRGPLHDCIVQLTHSHRYTARSGIGQLADAINREQPGRVLELLRDPALPDVALHELSPEAGVPSALYAAAAEGFAPFLDASDTERKLEALGRFRVLCAHRKGPFGQLAINLGVEARLRQLGRLRARGDRYPGRPIIVTQNDYQARLFNGDVGILEPDPAGAGRLLAAFVPAEGRMRKLSAVRLPPHESVYAMSVHKSQGSEFDEVAVLLPPEASRVVSRELLYTAVTRARKRVVIYANPPALAAAVQHSVERASGLRAALWQGA